MSRDQLAVSTEAYSLKDRHLDADLWWSVLRLGGAEGQAIQADEGRWRTASPGRCHSEGGRDKGP